MDLSEIRAAFITRSGRNDLVTGDNVDNGANFYVNAGQNFLDRLATTPNTVAKYYASISAGAWYKTFERCRSIDSVFMADDEDRWRLDKKDLSWILIEYGGPIADLDSGDPKYYCPALLRVTPEESDVITMSKVIDETVQIDSTEHYTYNGIIFMPPADESLILEIHGAFYSHKLTDNGDESYWSVNFPEILLMGALYELEISYRNTEGAKDWLAAITLEIAGIEFDLVQDDVAGVNQIED